MCGIAGIFYFSERKVEKQVLKKMSDAIAHRGPDGEGYWINPTGNVGFGHRRLSIIDLSEAASQPMQYANGRFTITYNGEIYNYLELKEALVKKGHVFKTQSDTEVLLALYDEKKESCLNDLDGMFAFAIWDEKEKKLFCARDRFGEKPFYYYADKEKFVFASEMKGLFAYGIKREIEYLRLHYYLAYDCIENPLDDTSTFFQNIRQLSPGHYLMCDVNNRIQKERYWQLNSLHESAFSEKEASEKIYHLFEQSVQRRLRSDVPVGSSLSGGIDSSAIVMLIDKIKPHRQIQKTFSAHFPGYEKDEKKFIDTVVNSCQNISPFFTAPDEKSFLNSINKILEYQEEPIGSASIVAQWEVMKLAKENNVTVLLDGQGADEIFAGYTPFFIPFLLDLYKKRSKNFSKEKKALQAMRSVNLSINFNTKLMLRYPKAFQMLSKAKKTIIKKTKNKKKQDEAGSALYHPDFYAIAKNFPCPVVEENNDHLKKAQVDTIERGGFQTLLRYADRNSMAFSREIRLPYLNHHIAEFAISLPDNLKIHLGWTKYVLRLATQNFLPEKIAWRKDKIAFEPPQKRWMEDLQIKDMVHEARKTLEKAKILLPSVKNNDWKVLMTAKLLQ